MDIKKKAEQIVETAVQNMLFIPAPTEKKEVEHHINQTAKPKQVRQAVQKLAHDMVQRNRTKVSNLKPNEPLSPELAEIGESRARQSSIITYEKGRAGADSRAWNSQMMNAAFKQPKENTPAKKKPKTNVEGASKEKVKPNPSDPLVMSYEINSSVIQENKAVDFGIQKAAGIGTFLTAKDLGINIQAGFALHPTVEEELEKRNDR